MGSDFDVMKRSMLRKRYVRMQRDRRYSAKKGVELSEEVLLRDMCCRVKRKMRIVARKIKEHWRNEKRIKDMSQILKVIEVKNGKRTCAESLTFKQNLFGKIVKS